MATKRSYKLQEFVAHSSNVNCLKIGRKSSRLLVTGGEDHKVNLWAIGKPNVILSLSGHTSGIDSVNFDHSEVVVAAGAASGSVKLWDLEEAKILRTLTGHRSNCISLDFHPFGEFFASGSSDTNLKIWDMRKKGCIHTYKGHTRDVNAIRFTPDGRWIVSGGEDNTVKIWDLTAGKLMHDFKFHEGGIQSIDFHPHEFLLATGSADRTVKFWDLETFELIGSTTVESTGVRCLTFNPDGRTLLCGLHETLKVAVITSPADLQVFSWEPVRCHDSVEIGWSKLSDFLVHDEKLLGCSYNQCCVGVWVVDIKQIEPYARNGQFKSVHSEISTKLSPSRSFSSSTGSLGQVSLSQNSDFGKESSKEQKSLPGNPPATPLRASARTATASIAPKKINLKVNAASNSARADVIPVIVPRNSRTEQLESRKENGIAARTMPFSLQAKAAESRKSLFLRDDAEVSNAFPQSDASDMTECNVTSLKTLSLAENSFLKHDSRMQTESPNNFREESYNSQSFKGNHNPFPSEGRTRPHVIVLDKRGRLNPEESSSMTSSANDMDPVIDILEPHEQFVSTMHSRLAKLQAVYKYWERLNLKGVIDVTEKMADHAVAADVIGALTERMDLITLDICSSILPLLHTLLGSSLERHLNVSIEMLLKLVRTFGSTIYSTRSASTPVGVDIEAEQRMERYNQCFSELEKIKERMPVLMKRSGSVAKSAQELNLAFQDFR